MKKLFCLILVLALAVSAVGCGGGASGGADPILIGLYGPYSGDAAMVGQTEVEGVELAVEQINGAGGIHGREIKIIKEDDAQTPTVAASAVNKLIYSDNVLAVIGTVNSGCALASLKVSREAGVPHVVPIASGASITKSGNPWVARIQASDLLQAGAAVDYLVKNGAKKIGLIYQSDDYGAGAAEVIRAKLQNDYNMEPGADEPFESNATDMKPQLQNIKDAGCDAIILWTMYQQGALIARNARELGMQLPMAGGGGLTNPKLYELGGDAVVGVVNSQTFFADNPNSSEIQTRFIADFEKKYSKTPDSNSAMSYDAMMVLAEGLRYAGPELNREKIMEGIRAIKGMSLATGVITINEDGDAVREDVLMVRLVGDKQYELVAD